MPGTHLLPPNLLKLFAPRPPLPYLRPVGRDIDRVTNKSVSGVGQLLEQLRETKTAGMLSSGEAPDTENGEDTSFTFAEETKRQIRREERKKRREEQFKIAKDTCNTTVLFLSVWLTLSLYIDKPSEDSEAVGDPYKTLFIARLVCRNLSLYNSALMGILAKKCD